MDKSFIEDLIKKIDALPEESFKRIVTEPIEVFQNPKSDRLKQFLNSVL
jgi:ABC-type histidine transport system ATPase subunit